MWWCMLTSIQNFIARKLILAINLFTNLRVRNGKSLKRYAFVLLHTSHQQYIGQREKVFYRQTTKQVSSSFCLKYFIVYISIIIAFHILLRNATTILLWTYFHFSTIMSCYRCWTMFKISFYLLWVAKLPHPSLSLTGCWLWLCKLFQLDFDDGPSFCSKIQNYFDPLVAY